MIELFSADTPNGKKISIMLEEFGYDFLRTDTSGSLTINKSKNVDGTKNQLNFDKRKKLRKEITKLKKEATRYESLVEKTENRISEIEKKFEIEDFYLQTSREEVKKLENEKNRLNKELSENIKQWEIFSHNLEIAEERLGV